MKLGCRQEVDRNEVLSFRLEGFCVLVSICAPAIDPDEKLRIWRGPLLFKRRGPGELFGLP